MILGLVGFATAGKDSVADILVRECGFVKMGFADALREMALALDPIVEIDEGVVLRYSDLLNIYGYNEAKKWPEIRRLLQRLGTEAGRGVLGESIWVDTAMKRAAAIKGPVVFTDCRFQNEADAIKAAGGRIVRVVREGVGPVNDHASEHFAATVDADYTVCNLGTLEDLAKTTRHMYGLLGPVPF